MSLTSALLNANNAAAAAGAGKKAAQVQLQAELNTDEEWAKFLQRDGLLVVDVYSEWCGPCIGMVGNLKKIKVEIGGDNLHLAVAKADTIECLKRFRNRSEPTWLFIAAGQLVNIIFGADAPRIARTIEQELKNEELAKKGERERPQRAPHELTPEEQEVVLAQEKLIAERRERERAAAAAEREERRETRARRVDQHFADVCAGLLLPHAQKYLRKVSDALEPFGVLVADKLPLLLGKIEARRLAVEEPEMGKPAAMTALTERPSLALLLKKQPDKEGDIIEICRRVLYGEGLEEEERPKKLVCDELRLDGVPGIYVPADRQQRAAVLELLFPKMVGALVEPLPPPQPPHVAMMFGAWQRRAVLAAAAKCAARVLKHGFFADPNVAEPRLLCKTANQYEDRLEKDYCETIVLEVAVGLAEPELADPADLFPPGPPAELLALGPIHVSVDAVEGALECARFFPPGYCEPEEKPKPKIKKKKKKRQGENKEEAVDPALSAAPSSEGEASTEAEAAEAAEDEADQDEADEDEAAVDKATSPPPMAE
ncbi:thioredoxin domain-containing protein 3 homolog isoform X1 [Cydia fagiglandana]|uniref:thioredoxin domain-containing protein 3 homolog isoform X1 n=1 Tax=Cydia fagiglandana TaxID=1458189 RepID=UPI002FEE55BE